MYLPVGATAYDIYNALAVSTPQGEVHELGTYQLRMTGNFDLNNAGSYVAHVYGTDALGVRVEQDMLICVE